MSGPSGAGKSTICNKVLQQLSNIEFSISCTTRNPRVGEIDGKDYYFITKEQFDIQKNNNDFFEYAKVHGNYYGTLKSSVIKKLEEGIDIILDIDIQGAMSIKHITKTDNFFAKSVETILIAPPTFKELEKRLRGRKTDHDDVIKQRLKTSIEEMEKCGEYDYFLINDNLDEAVINMTSFIRSIRMKTKRIKDYKFNE